MEKDMKARHIKANGETSVVEPANGTDFSLKEMQGFVGGWIEVLYTPDGKYIMVLNEEGKLDELPFNAVATKIAIEEFGLVDDYIAGDVLIAPSEQVK